MNTSIRTYQTIARNLLYEKEATVILQQLQRAGVKVIVLKGVFLSKVVYQNLHERSMNDIDLLIQPNDLETACEIFQNLGFQIKHEPDAPFSPFRSADTGELTFVKPTVVVDLHWELISVEWLRQLFHFKTQMVWENAKPLEVNGASALQLDPADLLLHLCFHLVAHSYAHKVGYEDAARVIRFYTPFPWEIFTCRVDNVHMRPAVYFALEALDSQYPGLVPSKILELFQPSGLQRRIVYWIADPRQVMQGESDYSHSHGYLLHVAVAGRLSDILRLLIWLMFPGVAWLRRRHRLSSQWAAWFACLWHPFFVLTQGIGSIITIIRGKGK